MSSRAHSVNSGYNNPFPDEGYNDDFDEPDEYERKVGSRGLNKGRKSCRNCLYHLERPDVEGAFWCENTESDNYHTWLDGIDWCKSWIARWSDLHERFIE